MNDKKDSKLNIPAESNREKHLNFMDAEEKTVTENRTDENRIGGTREDEERREQWQQGLDEGWRNAAQNDQ